MAIGGKTYGGWTKASVYDPATGTVVQINNISNEGTSLAIENITVDTTDSRIYGGVDYMLNLTFFDDAGFAQLRQWAQDFTPVRIVIAGATNLQWYEDTTITITKQVKPDKRGGLELIVLEAAHVSDEPAIYENQNIMAYLGNVDNGTVVFPIVGAELTFSANATATGGSLSLGVDNFAGTSLATSSETVSATGVDSTVLTLPASAYQIDFSASTATTDYHALTTNGALTGTTRFMNW